MRFKEYIEKLETIKYLIEHKRAGTPAYLSEKLNVSKSTLARMIRLLKDEGYPIVFNRDRNRYELSDKAEKE